jgi:uncharacterized YccA/Bax inhibitor family protein
MFDMKSSNPIFNSAVFQKTRVQDGNVMTIDGTVNKTGLLLGITVLSSIYAWQSLNLSTGLWIGVLIVGLACAFITYSQPQIAHITAPIYCTAKGLLIGSYSAILEARYPGIVVNALVLTFGLLAVMLTAYKSGYIRATPRFQKMISFGLMAYFVLFLVSLVSHMFGGGMTSVFFSGTIGLVLSLLIVGLASFSLVMDFEQIEQGARAGLPKQHEWLGAFGLMVTLIWLYLEVLRLLMILNSRRD